MPRPSSTASSTRWARTRVASCERRRDPRSCSGRCARSRTGSGTGTRSTRREQLRNQAQASALIPVIVQQVTENVIAQLDFVRIVEQIPVDDIAAAIDVEAIVQRIDLGGVIRESTASLTDGDGRRDALRRASRSTRGPSASSTSCCSASDHATRSTATREERLVKEIRSERAREAQGSVRGSCRRRSRPRSTSGRRPRRDRRAVRVRVRALPGHGQGLRGAPAPGRAATSRSSS